MLQQKFNAFGPEAPGDAGDPRLRLVGEEVDAVLATAGISRGHGLQPMTADRSRLPGLVVLAALAALVAILGWRAWGALEAGRPTIPSLGAPQSPDLSILDRFDPFFRERPDEAGDSLPVTSLPLTLKGIRLETVSGRGSAIVAGADGVQVLVVQGEEVMPGVFLRSLAVDHVILDNSGTPEALWLDEAGGAARPLAVPDRTDGAFARGRTEAAAGGDVTLAGDGAADDREPPADPAPDEKGDD
jgi:hypothetical protein